MYVYTETLPSSHHHCCGEGLTVDSIHGSDSCLVHGRQKKRNKNIKQTFVVRLSWPSPHIIFTFVVRLSWPNPHIIVVSGREYPPVHSLKPPMHWDRRCDVASCAQNHVSCLQPAKALSIGRHRCHEYSCTMSSIHLWLLLPLRSGKQYSETSFSASNLATWYCKALTDYRLGCTQEPCKESPTSEACSAVLEDIRNNVSSHITHF